MKTRLKMLVQICLFFLAGYMPGVLRSQSPFNINLSVIRRSVVFLYVRNAAGELQSGGTAFLMYVPTKGDPNRAYFLLVTARHIVDPAWAGCPAVPGTIFAVVNKLGYDSHKGEKGTIEYPLNLTNSGHPSFMFSDDDSVDIAVTVLNPAIIGTFDQQFLSVTEIPSPDELKSVGTGAQVVSAGLLLGAQGIQRNYPIFKFGNISSVPDEKIPTACCAGCATRAETQWMIAASLVGGNSGSPIFFVPTGIPGVITTGQRSYLLGIQSTSFAGSDVAGMAPVSYLLDILRKLALQDANLPPEKSASAVPPATPTMAHPEVPAVAGPIPH